MADDQQQPQGVPADEPGIAQGAQTLVEVLDQLAGEGYSGEFRVTRAAPPQLECRQCGHAFAPEAVRPTRLHRLEGASDPDELLAVAALRCPQCGAKGAVTLTYGATADEDSAAVLAAMPVPDPAREV
jgi:hypothetical protein